MTAGLPEESATAGDVKQCGIIGEVGTEVGSELGMLDGITVGIGVGILNRISLGRYDNRSDEVFEGTYEK